MNILLSISNFLLEQTTQEKRLTILYVSLFVVLVGMLVLDAFAMNKFTNKMKDDKPRFMHILLLVILIIAIVALIILFISGRK